MKRMLVLSSAMIGLAAAWHWRQVVFWLMCLLAVACSLLLAGIAGLSAWIEFRAMQDDILFDARSQRQSELEPKKEDQNEAEDD